LQIIWHAALSSSHHAFALLSSYSERLRALKLPSLSYRRLRGDMIEVYKILNGKYDQDACTILKLWKDMAQRSNIRGNSLKLIPKEPEHS
jgi:hypothetical protein